MNWDDLQSDAFTLFTITFDALTAGTSAISLNSIVLSDSFGIPITVDNTIDGQVTIVPEPATLALIGLGLAGIGYMRRRSKVAIEQ